MGARFSRRAGSGTVVLGMLGAALGIGMTTASLAAEIPDQLTPVLAGALAPPAPVLLSDGAWKLPYELELTNVTDVPITIESVDARDPDRNAAVVVSYAATQVAAQIALPGGAQSATLGPGQSGVLFLTATFKRRGDVPRKLVHRIIATTSQPKGLLQERTVEEVAPTSVAGAEPIVIGAPLRGDRWVAAASCCDSYHRRAVLPVNGARHLAQRFAIDWLRLDQQNRLASADPARNESYPQFGATAIAVLDAIVAHVQDGLPEGTPGSFPDTVTAATADGNSVILDLGGWRYALYAHLQPGSIRVRQGDHVSRGQTLGLVGNTGNSDAPHLHFHVMDGPSPLASNGLPYAIDAFDVTGRVVSASDLNDELKTAGTPLAIVRVDGQAKRTNELPADLVVVRFPD
jgi:hypothetical protein